jgi:hypothetical protein
MDILDFLIEFVNSWRSANGVTGGTPLSGQNLINFAIDLQATISNNGLATLYWTKLLRTRNYFNYSSYPADFKVFNPLYSTGVR